MPPGSASLGRAPGLWSPWFRRAVGLGSDAWRGATNPANWLGLAKGLGMGVVGGAVTGSLNWLGGKASPSLHGNDTYGGAFLHLGTSALGGAIAGSRGGPLGAGIGAVAGLVGNDVGRIYDELHGAYANTYGAAYTMHQQVDAAQEALLRREPRVGSDFEAAMAARRAAAAKEQQRFETWERGFDARASVASAMDAVVSDRYDRLHARWVAMNHPQTQTHTAQGAHSHGFTRPDWQQRVNRDYGHGAEPRPGMTTVHRMVGQPAGVAHAAGTHVGNVTATATAASYPASPNAPATNDAAVRSAAAAMDQLAASSGRLQAAFESLASRVNSLCQNNGNGSGNGLQFAPGGQQGGWYAGRQP